MAPIRDVQRLVPGLEGAQAGQACVMKDKPLGAPALCSTGTRFGQAQLDSQIWDFCLRAWMQART